MKLDTLKWNDSIHSKIEKKSKYVPVYTPEGWAQIIRSARSNPFPFEVKCMTFDDFMDFKLFASVTKSNIPWRRVCWLQYRKDTPDTVFYKTNFEDDFINAKMSTKRRCTVANLHKAYVKSFAISNKKKNDLLKMCEDLTIPKAYHSFYASIPSNVTTRDCLPEPDREEDSEYE